MMQGQNLSQSVGLGLGNDDELVGGWGSFISRQVRKVGNIAEDVARPVTAVATGDFDDAARALKNAVVAPIATPVALVAQVATGNAPDLEAARDTGIRVADKIGSAAMDAIRSAIRAAARPVVQGFMHGEEICFGDDIEGASKGEIKTVATAAALPITTAAAASAGSAIPGVGTAGGSALAITLTPEIVSQIVDELWEKGKRQIADAVASGVPNEVEAAKQIAQDQKDKNRNTVLLLGGGVLLLYIATRKGKKGVRK